MMRVTFFMALVAVAGTAQAANPNAAAMLGRMEGADTNRDGVITRNEVLAFRANNFTRLDRDSNGVLTRSDIPAFVSRLNPALDFNSMIQQFDSNKDGKVSRDEFVTGPTLVFDAADANKDGQLTIAERKAAMAAAKR
jgi:EF-hand domain pair/EF hand